MWSLLQDMRYGLRMMGAAPGFTAIALVTLALGIGVSTGLYTVMHANHLIAWRFTEPEELVFLWSPEPMWERSYISALDFLDWREQATVFADMGIYTTKRTFFATTEGDAERVRTVHASSNMLPMLGFDAQAGRLHSEEEDSVGAPDVVIMSDRLWERRFNRSPDVLGEVIFLDDVPHTVVGVMPPEVCFERLWHLADLLVPLKIDTASIERESRWFSSVARLRQEATAEQAQAEMSAIAARLEAAYPDSNAGRTVLVEPLLERFLPRDDAMLELALLVAVGGVLVIACVNLANFMMARATSRGREIAVRMAMGAGRRRIVRQLLTESMIIALIGGCFGFLVGVWAVDIFLAKADFAYLWMDYEIRLSLPVFTYGLLLVVATALAFGLVPALTASRVSVNESLKEGTAAATPGGSRSRTRNLLVIGQLAMVLPLLVCCGLAVRHIQYLRSTATVGFNPDRLLSMRVDLPMHRYEDGARRAAFFDEIVEKMTALPWIEGASAALSLPVGDGSFVAGRPITIEGRTASDSSRERIGGYQVVTPEHFGVMGIPLLRGRYFTDEDHADALRVAIISQRMAERDWPDEDPIGRRFALDEDLSQANWFTVVGIVADAGCSIMGEPPRPTLYLPHRQQPDSEMTVVARASGEPLDTVQALRAILREADPRVPVYDIRTLEETIHRWLRDDRLLAGFLGLLAALALGLACIGLYGVMSYSVGQRTHEIGVRLALGATGREISWMVLRSCVKLCSIGILIGLVVAAPVGVLVASFMYGIGGFDPVTLLGVTLLLLSVSVLAGYLPARRAMRVDPIAALRCE